MGNTNVSESRRTEGNFSAHFNSSSQEKKPISQLMADLQSLLAFQGEAWGALAKTDRAFGTISLVVGELLGSLGKAPPNGSSPFGWLVIEPREVDALRAGLEVIRNQCVEGVGAARDFAKAVR